MKNIIVLLVLYSIFYVNCGIIFSNTDSQTGINYGGIPSPELKYLEDTLPDVIPLQNILGFGGFGSSPTQEPLMGWNSFGTRGTVIFDYDGDGDEDIYVTNGPGKNNSLFTNLLVENCNLEWRDDAYTAGVAAFLQDNTGACAGDMNNDGFIDLFVLARNAGTNQLFLNNGDGTFTDISYQSNLTYYPGEYMSCAMGDLNNDGYLDIVVTQNVNFTRWWYACFMFPDTFSLSYTPTNVVLMNVARSATTVVLSDVTASTPLINEKNMYWSVSIIDYDMDGHMDIVTTSTDCAGDFEWTDPGKVDHGFIHFYKNLGNGTFLDLTQTATANASCDPRMRKDHPGPGDWKGLSWGDYNNDGLIDLMSTNFGDNDGDESDEKPYEEQRSRWFLQTSDHKFPDMGGCYRTNPNETEAPFTTQCCTDKLNGSGSGWVSFSIDYNLDGLTDILYFGGQRYLDWSTINAGTVLQNQGDADFDFDATALSVWSYYEILRSTHGGSTGDLNKDGFPDIILVSTYNIPESRRNKVLPYVQAGFSVSHNSPFDNTTYINTVLGQSPEPGLPVYFNISQNGPYLLGDLAILLNSADNNRYSVKVKVMGTKGITTLGRVNRDGIGAMVTVTPKRTDIPQMFPILAGEATHSQSSFTKIFGLGSQKSRATVDVFWPGITGGVWNRLNIDKDDHSVFFPEIPCNYKGSMSFNSFKDCVDDALDEIEQAGHISSSEAKRFKTSMKKAYQDYH